MSYSTQLRNLPEKFTIKLAMEIPKINFKMPEILLFLANTIKKKIKISIRNSTTNYNIIYKYIICKNL